MLCLNVPGLLLMLHVPIHIRLLMLRYRWSKHVDDVGVSGNCNGVAP